MGGDDKKPVDRVDFDAIIAKDGEVEPQKPPPKKEEFKFCYPICGHDEFKEVRKNNGVLGPGGRSWTEYCVCRGCSVVFEDPKKFGVVKSKKSGTRVVYRGEKRF